MMKFKKVNYIIESSKDTAKGMLSLTFGTKKERDSFVKKHPKLIMAILESYPAQIESLRVLPDIDSNTHAYIPLPLSKKNGKTVFDGDTKKDIEAKFRRQFKFKKKIPIVYKSSKPNQPSQKGFFKTAIYPVLATAGTVGAVLSSFLNLSGLFLVGSIGIASASLIMVIRNYIYQKTENEITNKIFEDPLTWSWDPDGRDPDESNRDKNNNYPNTAYLNGIEAGKTWTAYFKKGYLPSDSWKNPLAFGAGMMHTANKTKKCTP